MTAPTNRREIVRAGIAGLDDVLNGGLTKTLIMEPAGAGKSALATQYVVASAERGENAAIFVFDESSGTLFARSDAIRMPLQKHVDGGRVTVQQIDPAAIPPGEFVHLVREAVEQRHITMLVIDSLNGYLNAMPEEHFLSMFAPVDVSYLADSVILLRYFELAGEIRKAVSVVKKRSGQHEKAIRPFTLGADGLVVGAPLTEFRRILSGTPRFDAEMGRGRVHGGEGVGERQER